jgi:hypothetical protein
MTRTLTADLIREATAKLMRANAEVAARFPGSSPARQPVHTVYGGAHLFQKDVASRLGEKALASLARNAPDAGAFAEAVGIPAALAETVYARVTRKLETEPVEDYRIDFEDGFGNRSDQEEDAYAESTALDVAEARDQGLLPPFIGLRIKPLTEELRERSLRTLDIFLTTLMANGGPPEGFRVTLPKLTSAAQPAALAEVLELLEWRLGIPERSLTFEIMVETPQSIVDMEGRFALPGLVAAARGRCVSAHFGTYDYSAGLDISAAHQHMTHPACDFAKHAMQVSLAGTGVTLSDGATNVMPVGDRASVHAAWRLHYGHVRHSLEGAFYQGWDLHPAQLPTRYAAVFAFFLEAAPAAKDRLANFIDKAAQATLVGDVFDDAATGQGLLNFFLRGISCGAIAEEEVLATGITVEELQGRSFL